MAWIRLPREIAFGYGTINHLAEMDMKRVAVICGGASTTRLAEERILPLLKGSGKEAELMPGVRPEPPMRQVVEFKERLLEFEPDWILGFGGGSAIDLAKSAWVFYEQPELPVEEKIKEWGTGPIHTLPPIRRKARLVAIETTSGTGTAVTRGSVIIDEVGKKKYPVRSYDIVPDVAIYDPEVCLAMPPHITANTGMDALTHAIEAYVSTQDNAPAEWLALRAIQYVFRYLPRAYANPVDREAREKMHEANLMAAIAFSNASLGITHAHAHSLGGHYRMPHGLANAVMLPYVIDFNIPAAEAKYAEIARFIGLGGLRDADLAAGLITEVLRLEKLVGIPGLKDALGDDLDDFLTNLDSVAKDAFDDPTVATNPRKVSSPADTKAIYQNALQGRLIHG
ncbi:MAG TPA: iron-containing alcohol dehydrogenase [Dehalococcoidia bacterium]|nr:iron-containing alcohol dehydrogenase [Dehalococcoidia bacterium]